MTTGDRAPNFMLTDQHNEIFELYTAIMGGPIVLVFLSCQDQRNADLLRSLSDSLPELLACNAHLFAVCDDTVESHRAVTMDLGLRFPLIADADGKVSRWFLDRARCTTPVAFVLDPNQRVVSIIHQDEKGSVGFVAESLDVVRSIAPTGEPTCFGTMAPALIVPNVIDRDYCQRLIEAWETGDRHDGRVRTGVSEGTVQAVDLDFKRRVDHIIEDPQLSQQLAATMISRLGPEVYKVYYYDNWTFEKFRIGCYEANDAGCFKPHRDNYNDAVKYRRYALTLNLNAEDYEGGDLRFPEYGIDLYRPPTGGGIVFSCSLLHEVVPVTKGRRFALLTFLIPAKPDEAGPAM